VRLPSALLLLALQAAGDAPDLSSVPADLKTPAMTSEEPAAGDAHVGHADPEEAFASREAIAEVAPVDGPLRHVAERVLVVAVARVLHD